MNSRPELRRVPRAVPAEKPATAPSAKKLRKTNDHERHHRDDGWCTATQVAPRDERGEIPD